MTTSEMRHVRSESQLRRRLLSRSILLAGLAAATLCMGACSVVFTAGVSGVVVDAEEFSDDPATGGLNGVRVYLYLRENPRTADQERYESDGFLPDEEGGDNYYLNAVTDTLGSEAGAFSFPTIYWHDLFPRYGRSGDRRDVHLLLYHPEYGLVGHTASIVSDTTNTMAPIEVTSIFETAAISGVVERSGSSTGVADVTVSAHVASSWDGSVFSYDAAPAEEAVSDATGTFSMDIVYPRELGGAAGGGGALLLFEADDYLAVAADDAELNDDRDVDGDGSNDVYHQTPLLLADEVTELEVISIRQTAFSETLDGRVGVDVDADSNIDVGTNGAVVALYFNRSVGPAPGDPPDLTTTSSNRLVDQDVEAGWFSFSDITWDDVAYTGSQSSITCYVDVDSDANGTIDVDNRLVTVYSNTSNTTQIVLP
jgi:hypothetical protein